jgi:DNA-binding transcriptional LysR family regulator
VASTVWVTILPGVMMASDIESRHYVINPLTDPPLETDLVLIEPARQPLSPAAETFLTVLEQETTRLNGLWKQRDRPKVPVNV